MAIWVHNFLLPFLMVAAGYIAGVYIGVWFVEFKKEWGKDNEESPL